MRFRFPFFRKSTTGVVGSAATAFFGVGIENFAKGDYTKVMRESYGSNVVVYRCLNDLAAAIASVKMRVYKGKDGEGAEITEGGLPTLLRRPNVLQTWSQFILELVVHRKLYGDAYIHVNGPDNGEPTELWALNPSAMSVETDTQTGFPSKYVYQPSDGARLTWDVDSETQASPIVHLVELNPLSTVAGLSALSPAVYSIDIHNASSQWNAAILKNQGRPCGVLRADGTLTDGQFESLKTQFEQNFSGSGNAGKPLVLDGGLQWQPMGLTASDLEWLEGRMLAAREIAYAIGVPPMLLGLPGDNTYSNYQEARLAFWENTVIPAVNELADVLTNHIASLFGDDVAIKPDTSEIPALEYRMSQRMQAVNTATFLTPNEKRAMFGYEPISGGDVLQGAAPAADPLGAASMQGGATPDEEGALQTMGAANKLLQTNDAQVVTKMFEIAYGKRRAK